MIEIKDKHDCCSCSACVQRCPKQCISLHEDEEGFLYPKVDINTCINCGLCEKVCPILHQGEPRKPLKVYAAKNLNEEIRIESSSGGVFTLLAEKTIDEGGVVFGVKWNKHFEAIHAYAETKEEIAAFRGSKYVQSYVGDTFRQAESFLKQGRKVLFSGTPCQISALYHFLSKEYENLLTIEVVCHGVVSPKIWREYLQTLKLNDIGVITHKDKISGWRNYSITIKNTSGKVIFSEKASDNKYLMAFARNLTLRPSCFSCPTKAGKSQTDIIIGDYWGIEHFFPQLDDNKGISFICCNSLKGKNIIEQLELGKWEADYSLAVPYNSCIANSTSEPVNRKQFWAVYRKDGIKALLVLKKNHSNIILKIIRKIFR